MTNRRRAAVIGAVAVGLGTLAACEQPTPLATITAGSDSVHTEAACYKDGDKLSDSELRKCLQERPSKTLTVPSGEKVHIGVDPDIADNGWFLALDGQPVTNAVKDTYRSYDGDPFFANQQTGQTADEVTVTVVEGSAAGGGRGVWTFKLKRGE